MPNSVIQTSCTQANKKILDIKKARVLGNAFVDSQFNYVDLIWIFCKKAICFKMHKIHHKTLRLFIQSSTKICLIEIKVFLYIKGN